MDDLHYQARRQGSGSWNVIGPGFGDPVLCSDEKSAVRLMEQLEYARKFGIWQAQERMKQALGLSLS
jgi:hypothetical protein